MAEGRMFRPVVEVEKCRSCQLCLGRCPSEWNPELGSKEDPLKDQLYPANILEKPFDQPSRLPVCQQACPIHQDTRGYAALIAQGKRQEALELIRENNPLPAVCGYICHHPCEAVCLSSRLNEAVPLRLLKRFVAEEDLKTESKISPFKITKKARVLIVGSGPAGLTAAHDLASQGYRVTIFESLPVLGGMLKVGIPAFRLPREILDKEIERIRRRGVDMQLRKTFKFQDITKNLNRLGFQAAFLAMGAHKSRRLAIPGERFSGVIGGVEFLRKFNLGQKLSLGTRVIVIGGGNVALDCARVALRLGAKEVRIVYRRSLYEMPAIPEEITIARKEGIEFLFLSMPMSITKSKNNRLKLDCLKTILAEADAGSRQQPLPQPGSEFSLWADSIISAVGQEVDRRISGDLELQNGGTLKVHPHTGQTSVKGIFAGGDVVTGPGWAIEAIAAGKKGAAAINDFLS